MIGATQTTVQSGLPSYLYFQYQDDDYIKALILAYNELSQGYTDWLNNINLPVYTGLNGYLLDWVGQGVYGYPRPILNITTTKDPQGQIAGQQISAMAISETKVTVVHDNFPVTDDYYKRLLTWFFYKDDGQVFSIPWLKRRIYRFLYGDNGTDATGPFTPGIGVEFTEAHPGPDLCTITLTSPPQPIGDFFQVFIDYGNIGLPFYFSYTVVIV